MLAERTKCRCFLIIKNLALKMPFWAKYVPLKQVGRDVRFLR